MFRVEACNMTKSQVANLEFVNKYVLAPMWQLFQRLTNKLLKIVITFLDEFIFFI